MTDLNIDHLSRREQYLMTLVYSAFLGYTKNDQDGAAKDVNYIIRCADELEPAEPNPPQPSASVGEMASWEDWNDGDSAFLCIPESNARYEVSFSIHEGHSGVWRAYFNPDIEREPIKETHLGTFASKDRAKKECEDHRDRTAQYRDNDGGVPYVY